MIHRQIYSSKSSVKKCNFSAQLASQLKKWLQWEH